MLQRNERGEQAGNYFIKVEETLKAVAQNNLPQLTPSEQLLLVVQNQVALEKEVKEIKQTQQKIEDKLQTTLTVFASPRADTWKDDMDNAITALVETYKQSPSAFRGRLYKELEQQGGVSLNSRVLRLQDRLKKQGITYKERQAITKLDAISKDKKLRLMFEAIVKKYQALYEAQ